MGDYIKDGITYCGKCHSPKETKIYVPLMKQEKIFPCRCKCEQEEIALEDKLRKIDDFKYEIEQHRKIAFGEHELSKNTFANDKYPDTPESKIAREYVEKFSIDSNGKVIYPDKGLLMCGNVGTGKTFYGCCIANALVDKGIRCVVTNFPRIVNTLQGMFEGRQEYLDGLNSFSLLVIDDLAVERNTEYVNELVTNVIDGRYRIGKPLVITTNLTASQIYAPSTIEKERIYSRLIEMCRLVEFGGKDKRKEKQKC